jgi:hypothetical protein
MRIELKTGIYYSICLESWNCDKNHPKNEKENGRKDFDEFWSTQFSSTHSRMSFDSELAINLTNTFNGNHIKKLDHFVIFVPFFQCTSFWELLPLNEYQKDCDKGFDAKDGNREAETSNWNNKLLTVKCPIAWSDAPEIKKVF